MIHLVLPVSGTHGWGICGKYLARELAGLDSVRLISSPFTVQMIGDELEYDFLCRLSIPPEELPSNGQTLRVDTPVLIGVDNDLRPKTASVRGTFSVGYTFFEESVLPAGALQNAKRYLDVIATGSRWNSRILEEQGLKNVVTVIQGIDPLIFNPLHNEKEFLRDRFVVFSGGKLELRKGQDLVIRAFKALQDKHKDVCLVNSWFNPWQFSLATMGASPYIYFHPTVKDHSAMIQQVLGDNGIDASRVITLLPRVNSTMSRIYKNTDVGLFPNRAEGGTNLVLMEYMACGKPVIAANGTGQRDVLTSENALLIQDLKNMPMFRGSDKVADWVDPSLDETIAHLEWAYLNREKLQPIARRAGEDLAKLTWSATARNFHQLLTVPR